MLHIYICDSTWEKGPIALKIEKLKNELFIPLCRALLMECFDTKFISRRCLVH